MCRCLGTGLVYNRSVRVIVFALLLANLLFMGWAEWIDVPGPPPPSSIKGLPRLTLVSELPPDKRAELAHKMALQAAPKCVSVGPFDDPAIAAQAVAVLKTRSFAPQQRIVQAAAIRRFWVYLDGLESEAAVTRVLHTLERGGIDDAEAMPPEAGGRRISLGLFSDRDRADRRARAVRAMGLKPKTSERMVPGTVYWLDLTLPNGSVAVPLNDVSGLEPGGGTSPISVQPCPTGAAPATPAMPATPGGQVPQGDANGSRPLPAAANLPACKPGGGGTVPCVVIGPKGRAQPSVL